MCTHSATHPHSTNASGQTNAKAGSPVYCYSLNIEIASAVTLIFLHTEAFVFQVSLDRTSALPLCNMPETPTRRGDRNPSRTPPPINRHTRAGRSPPSSDAIEESDNEARQQQSLLGPNVQGRRLPLRSTLRVLRRLPGLQSQVEVPRSSPSLLTGGVTPLPAGPSPSHFHT